CFRREAGSYGKDTKGLYRVHQFQKVEQVIIGQNSEELSNEYHQELLENSEHILQTLELPYRIVKVCSGDLGIGAYYKHDIEAWMPSRQAYGETHSCSSFHEYQARRLKLRYKTKGGNNLFCHTLNNTAIASPRILIPFLEVHQTATGDVRIPKGLQPYIYGAKFLSEIPYN
ncbi:MAG: serine--tRNA ligase, partial [Proteobacteria bacterium]|nr:serine--tRNA ligase [Pseudomonadota bacterium]